MEIIQPQDFSDLLIIKGTDGYRGQAKGGGLEIYILPGVPDLNMNVPSYPVSARKAILRLNYSTCGRR